MEGIIILYSDESANIYVNVYFDNDTFLYGMRVMKI